MVSRSRAPSAVVFTLVSLMLAGSARAGPVVVLDPGHGGTNLGAPGLRDGLYEKAVTLAIARYTKRSLVRARPGLRVLLTRDRDQYCTLAQRVRLANRSRASVFVSIHLNATSHHTRSGYETFILSREASDREAEALAIKENLEPQSTAGRGGAQGGVVSAILADLRHGAAHADSARLAWCIQRSLARIRGQATDRGLRQASLDVLSGLRMSGVLVEVGFIDHAEEGQELMRPETQQALGQALAEGIIEHLGAPGVSRAR